MSSPHHTTRTPIPDPSWRTSIRHVWIRSQMSYGTDRYHGLLLGWRKKRDGAWVGWVVYADPGIPAHDDGPRVQQGWVAADLISAVVGE